MSDANQVTVVRDDENSRYELVRDGAVIGECVYVREGDALVFDHTVVDPAYGGQGLGTVLVREALTDVAHRGETVVPVCPFVVKFLQENDVPGLKVDGREAE